MKQYWTWRIQEIKQKSSGEKYGHQTGSCRRQSIRPGQERENWLLSQGKCSILKIQGTYAGCVCVCTYIYTYTYTHIWDYK